MNKSDRTGLQDSGTTGEPLDENRQSEPANDHLSSAVAHFEAGLTDAFCTLVDAIDTDDEFDETALLAFRRQLVELDILLEDAVASEGYIDVGDAPAWYVQDKACDLFETTVQLASHPRAQTFTTAWERINEIEQQLDAVAVGTVGEQVADYDSATEPRYVRPVVSITDEPLYIEEYPDRRDGPEDELSLMTREREQTVYLVANVSDCDRKASAALIVDPDTAEWLAGQLPQFAAKAREGEAWYYNG